MTWSAEIKIETPAVGDARSCSECKHMAGCNINSVSWVVGNLLTAVDTCQDGHMASGTAVLNCNGYESHPTAEIVG
jgi:hypothetical protein